MDEQQTSAMGVFCGACGSHDVQRDATARRTKNVPLKCLACGQRVKVANGLARSLVVDRSVIAAAEGEAKATAQAGTDAGTDEGKQRKSKRLDDGWVRLNLAFPPDVMEALRFGHQTLCDLAGIDAEEKVRVAGSRKKKSPWAITIERAFADVLAGNPYKADASNIEPRWKAVWSLLESLASGTDERAKAAKAMIDAFRAVQTK